jgi:hypothetical protein
VRGLHRRVTKIEEALKRKRNMARHTVGSPCGRVPISVTPLDPDRACVIAWFDSLTLSNAEALALIRSLVPMTISSLFVFPRILSREEWEQKYAGEYRNK